MFENLKNGWKLAGATRKLLFKDKQLLFYPVVSAVIAIVLAVAIFVPVLFIGNNSTAVILALILFYIVTSFASTYMLMALLIAFRSYANGKKISMSEALHQTAPYTMLIFEWALFYTILVMILRAIESRFGGIGRLLIAEIGSIAIAVATLFAIPVILDNKVGPITAVKDSVKVITKNFGSTFGGIIYADLYGMVFTIIGILVIVAAFVTAAASLAAAIVVGLIGVVLVVFGSIISYATSNVFTLILYDYINGKGLPSGFDKQMMNSSIKQKGQRSGPGTGSGMPDNTFA